MRNLNKIESFEDWLDINKNLKDILLGNLKGKIKTKVGFKFTAKT